MRITKRELIKIIEEAVAKKLRKESKEGDVIVFEFDNPNEVDDFVEELEYALFDLPITKMDNWSILSKKVDGQPDKTIIQTSDKDVADIIRQVISYSGLQVVEEGYEPEWDDEQRAQYDEDEKFVRDMFAKQRASVNPYKELKKAFPWEPNGNEGWSIYNTEDGEVFVFAKTEDEADKAFALASKLFPDVDFEISEGQ